MMDERMSLPIWPYRQQLLDAIAEEQVLIFFFFFITLGLEISDKEVYEP